MRLSGEMIPIVFEGTLNKEVFGEYLKTQVAPTLAEDDILLMDNCSVHCAKSVKEIVKKCNINVWYLPKYSPDLNPIELMWAYIKAILRKLKARTIDKLHDALKTAFDRITPELIKSWFSHCGYSP